MLCAPVWQGTVSWRVRLEVSVVAPASSPASERGVSPPASSSHRDGAGTRRRDGCATGLTDRFKRTRQNPAVGLVPRPHWRSYSPLPRRFSTVNPAFLASVTESGFSRVG